jgi:hypothetical protein
VSKKINPECARCHKTSKLTMPFKKQTKEKKKKNL